MNRPIMLLAMIAGFAGLLSSVGTFAADEEAVKLFDGKSLDGWHGDPDLWSVQDGAIVGTTDNKSITSNSFLSTKDEYGDFELRLKFRLRNGNSGVQFRSEQHDDYVVKGYQADIATERYMGILYEEGKRGILADVDPEEIAKHVIKDDWNEYVITVDGPHVVQKLNDHITVDYNETSDEAPAKGIIALQIHVGEKMKVWFKDLELTKLP